MNEFRSESLPNYFAFNCLGRVPTVMSASHCPVASTESAKKLLIATALTDGKEDSAPSVSFRFRAPAFDLGFRNVFTRLTSSDQLFKIGRKYLNDV